jgi:hypothetical protein
MALQTAQITVGTSAPVELTVLDYGRSSILISAPDASDLFVGGPAVTPATGFLVPAGSSLALELYGERLYGVLASGTGTVYVLRTGV